MAIDSRARSTEETAEMRLLALIDQFEAAWRQGEPRSVRQFLNALDASGEDASWVDRSELARELVKIDLEYRWRWPHESDQSLESAEKPRRLSLDDYAAECPELGVVERFPIDLIAEEYWVRHRWGDRPSHGAYRARFPEQAGALSVLLDAIDVAVGAGARSSFEAADPWKSTLGPDDEFPGSGAVQSSRPLRAIGGYELIDELGRGGMGVVYRARQAGLGRFVALKVLRGGSWAGRDERARFHREAHAVARLQHPNIVQIFATGEHEGRPFLVMELVEGGTLAKRISHAPLPPREAARLVETLAVAANYAHRRGVVHRDLKPANVLLELAGEPKIADFGLAKCFQRADLETYVTLEGCHTQTGAILGTPPYMAPEQVEGTKREVGAAADVYALGTILYEAMTGQPPFRGETFLDTLDQIRTCEPIAPRRLRPDLPRDLETIALKAMAKEPSARYPSAEAMAEDLRLFLADRSIYARRSTTSERLRRWCRRNPVLAGLSASVGLLVVLVAIIASISALRLGTEARRAQNAEHRALERLFHSSFAQAKASQGSGRIGQRHETLKALADAAALRGLVAIAPADILEMRSAAIAAMALPDVHLGPYWEGNPVGTNGHAFDSRYERYALSKNDGEVAVRQIADDRLLRRFAVDIKPGNGSSTDVSLYFSPSDRYLSAFYKDHESHQAVVWDLQSSDDRPLLAVVGASTSWSFMESKHHALIGTRDKEVLRFDLATGKLVDAIDVGLVPSAVAAQPQGEVVAVSSLDQPVIMIFDMARKRLLNTLSNRPDQEASVTHTRRGAEGLAWHPNGELLAVAGLDHRIHVWDWLAGLETRTLTGHNWEVANVAFSHTGALLASYARDKTVRLWDQRSGALLLTIPGARWVGFSRDDRILTAEMDGTRLALCYLDMPAEFRFFEAHHPRQGLRRDICDVRFDSRSGMLATACYGHSVPGSIGGFGDGVRLWDLATGNELARLSVAASTGVLMERDDRAILTFDNHRLRRWPIKESVRDGRAHLRIGPPELLLRTSDIEPKGRLGTWGQTGDRIAISELGVSVRLFELAPKPRVVQSWLTPTAHNIDASPDGRWVGTGSFEGPGIQVWDTQKNRQAHFWRSQDASVQFSPDGRWFATNSGSGAYQSAECILWKVGTWERGPSIPLGRTSAPSNVEFSPDGRIVSVARTMAEISLLDARDLHELARLKPRESTILSAWRFSPDSSLLAAGTSEGWVDIWDLRQIRARLKELQLDWDLPDYAPISIEPAPARPPIVELQLDTQSMIERAEYLLALQDYRGALADLEEALAREPHDPYVRRKLSEILSSGPLALRDEKRAADLRRGAAPPGGD